MSKLSGSALRAAMSPKGKRKMTRVMREFKHGTLRSSAGPKVTSRRQAIAIALRSAAAHGTHP